MFDLNAACVLPVHALPCLAGCGLHYPCAICGHHSTVAATTTILTADDKGLRIIRFCVDQIHDQLQLTCSCIASKDRRREGGGGGVNAACIVHPNN